MSIASRLQARTCVALALFTAACQSGPSDYVVSLEGSQMLNATSADESKTVTALVFQLKAEQSFDTEQYDAVYADVAAVVGSNLLGKVVECHIVKGRPRSVTVPVGKDTRFIGIVGKFDQPDANGGWFLCIPVAEVEDSTFLFEGYTIKKVEN